MFDVGRLCVKTAGREAGKYCVIVKRIDENFVMITGPRSITDVKRRKCNINHLEPLPEKISIKENASDEEVAKAYEKHGIIQKLGIRIPKRREAKKPEVKEKQKEKPKAATKRGKKESKASKKQAKKTEKK